jgi:hypothetical protein
MSKPIKYTSRDYNSIIADINSDAELIDKPEWYKRIWAGVGDVLALYEDVVANESYLDTAFTRRAVKELCRMIDYELSEHSCSSGVLIFELNADTVAFPKTLLTANLVAQSAGTQTQSAKRFEARANVVMSSTSETFTTNFAANSKLTVARVYTTGEKVRVSTTVTLPAPLVAGTDYWVIYSSATTIYLATSRANAYLGTAITLTSDGAGVQTIKLYSAQATCYQQTSVASVSVGTSDGATAWQKFNLPDRLILFDTLTVTINSVAWTQVDTLVESLSTDTDYKLYFNDDGSSYIEFGDGTYGKIPENFNVYVAYAYGGGSDSNISTLNRINSYAGGDADVSGVSNPVMFTGGGDHEEIESAKQLAPLLLKARERFVTVDDGKALVLAYAGVSQTIVIRNAYGILSCAVPIVPDGGGTPSGALRTAIQNYLIDKTILASVDVRVIDPDYEAISITMTVKMKTGYTFTTIKPYITLALRMMFTECGKELSGVYSGGGVAAAITYINAKWSTSFSSSDYAQITRLLDNFTPAEFGVSYQQSDVLGFIDSFVTGVDYCAVSSPAFPITITDYQISQDNIDPANITEIP